MYKLFNTGFDDIKCVIRLVDNAYIPFDQDNTDYKKYLKWVEEGNTPQPADPLPTE